MPFTFSKKKVFYVSILIASPLVFWSSFSLAYSWNDDVKTRIEALESKAAYDYINGQYPEYNNDINQAVSLCNSIEPKPQLDCKELMQEEAKKLIIAINQQQEESYQHFQSERRKQKDEWNKLSPEQQKAAKEKATANVDDLFDGLADGKNTPKTAKPLVSSKQASGSSGAEISSYASKVSQAIRSRAVRFDDFKGKVCDIEIHLKEDGVITNLIQKGGDGTFCSYLTSVIKGMNELPIPPSAAAYNAINGATLSFKP